MAKKKPAEGNVAPGGQADAPPLPPGVKLLRTLEGHQAWVYSVAFDPQGEAERYLAALADGKIFDLNADPVALLGEQDSIQGILELAIALEKDSVVFYVAIKETVPEGLGKDRVEQIIKEEMDHIILLSGIRSSLAR